MTAFDIIVVVIVSASVALSLFRGLVREVLSLFAWISAFVAAGRWGEDVALLVRGFFESPALAWALGYGLLFLAVLIAVGLINMALARLIRASGLVLADRGLGGLFGFARGVLVVLVLVVLAGRTPITQEPWWQQATLRPITQGLLLTVKPLLPPEYAAHIRL